MAATPYITIEGDRWDSIAYKAYGDATLYPAIIDANPSVIVDLTLPGGVELSIPIKEDAVLYTKQPPWVTDAQDVTDVPITPSTGIPIVQTPIAPLAFAPGYPVVDGNIIKFAINQNNSYPYSIEKANGTLYTAVYASALYPFSAGYPVETPVLEEGGYYRVRVGSIVSDLYTIEGAGSALAFTKNPVGTKVGTYWNVVFAINKIGTYATKMSYTGVADSQFYNQPLAYNAGQDKTISITQSGYVRLEVGSLVYDMYFSESSESTTTPDWFEQAWFTYDANSHDFTMYDKTTEAVEVNVTSVAGGSANPSGLDQDSQVWNSTTWNEGRTDYLIPTSTGRRSFNPVSFSVGGLLPNTAYAFRIRRVGNPEAVYVLYFTTPSTSVLTPQEIDLSDDELAACGRGPFINGILSTDSGSLRMNVDAMGVSSIDYEVLEPDDTVVTTGWFAMSNPDGSPVFSPSWQPTISFSVTLPDGSYKLRIKGRNCSSLWDEDAFTVTTSGGGGGGGGGTIDPGTDIAVLGAYSEVKGGRKHTYSKSPNFVLTINADGTFSDTTPGLNTSVTPNQIDGKTVFYQIGYVPLCDNYDSGSPTYRPLQNTYLPDGVNQIWQVRCNAAKIPNLASYLAHQNGNDAANDVNAFNATLATITLSQRTLADPKIPSYLQVTREYTMGKYGSVKGINSRKSYGLFRETYPDVSRADHHARGIHTFLELGGSADQPNTVRTFESLWKSNPDPAVPSNADLYNYGQGCVSNYGLTKVSLITDQIAESEGYKDPNFNSREYYFYQGALDKLREAEPGLAVVDTGLYGTYGMDTLTGVMLKGILQSYPRSVIAESLDSHRYDSLEPSTGAWRNAVSIYYTSGQIDVRNLNFDLYLYNVIPWMVPYEIMYGWERAMTGTKTYGGIDRQRKVIVYSTNLTQSLVGGSGPGGNFGIEFTNPGEVIPFPNGTLRTTFSMGANVSEYYDIGFWGTRIMNGDIQWGTPRGGVDATKIDHYVGGSDHPGNTMYWTQTGGSQETYVSGVHGAPENSYIPGYTGSLGLPETLWTTPDDVAYTGYQDARALEDAGEVFYYASYTSSRKSFTPVAGPAGYHVNGFGAINIGVGINIKDAIDQKKALAVFSVSSTRKTAHYYNGFLGKHEYEDSVIVSYGGTSINLGRCYGRKTYTKSIDI